MNKSFVPKRTLIIVKKVILIFLLFLCKLLLNLRLKLYNCFKKTLPPCNIKVIFESENHLGNLFWFKDLIPKELRSHLVYKLSCNNCNITYYSETECHFTVRSREHLSPSALTSKRVNNNKKLAFKDHYLFYNHVGSLKDFSILAYESNPLKLLIKESLLVSRDKPLLNKQVKSISLKLF